MAKEFYTEKDIEDLVKRGITSLELCDDIVLTELAYEKAERLGVKLIQPHQQRPGAPVRPYLSQQPAHFSQPSVASSEQYSTVAKSCATPTQSDLRERIRNAVVARLGSRVDPALLEQIINRVLSSTGIG